MAKKEGSSIFSNNRLLSTILIILVVYLLLNGSVTGDAINFNKKAISLPAQKTCVTNNDCSIGSSCKPVTQYVCQKDTTTTTVAPPAAVATCSDGIQNQGELRVDCGGANCPTCPPTCTDKIKNGAETDIDCGGSTCAVCANGKACALSNDCSSKYCNPNTKKCEVYIPKLRLTASTTATNNCPTGTTQQLTRATKHLWVSKVPNPTSTLSDFTKLYSGTNGWFHFCTADGISMKFANNDVCPTNTQFMGDALYGYHDGRSTTVITSTRAVINGITDTDAYCSTYLKAIDVTTDNQVDASKLACPSGYSSAGIISEDTSAGLMYTHFCVQ